MTSRCPPLPRRRHLLPYVTTRPLHKTYMRGQTPPRETRKEHPQSRHKVHGQDGCLHLVSAVSGPDVGSVPIRPTRSVCCAVDAGG
eukprot:2672526-Rhodomonas_salina.1